jgi:hypothetical protein
MYRSKKDRRWRKRNNTSTQQIVQGTSLQTPVLMSLWFIHHVARWYQSHCQKAAALAQQAA